MQQRNIIPKSKNSSLVLMGKISPQSFDRGCRMKVHFLLVIVLASLVAACSQPPPAPVSKPDLAMEEKAIRDVDAQWLKAVQEKNPSAEAALFASDGVAYRNHVEPMIGPAAVQAGNAKSYAENPKIARTWTTESIQIAQSGELAVQTGEYRDTGLGLKGDGEEKGRFLTIWKKVGSDWKVAYDMSLTTMPETPPAKKK
jgi:ketosteroid isomerase-like protein